MSKAVKAIPVSAKENAYRILNNTARIGLHEIKDNPGARTTGRLIRKGTNQAGHTQGALERAAKPPLGWIWGDFFRPWHRMFPGERNFNADIRRRRPLLPISLIELSRLIDLGWIDPSKPIDLPSLLSTRKLKLRDEVGIMLTSQGFSSFTHTVAIEVQSCDQESIGAIEKAGGTIRTAYYDSISLKCVSDTLKWFSSGEPIPSRKVPPSSLYQKYCDPINRGYLSSKEDIVSARKNLADLMGYEYIPEKLSIGKKVNEVFNGIPSGSVVSVKDKKIFLPTHSKIKDYYNSEVSFNYPI